MCLVSLPYWPTGTGRSTISPLLRTGFDHLNQGTSGTQVAFLPVYHSTKVNSPSSPSLMVFHVWIKFLHLIEVHFLDGVIQGNKCMTLGHIKPTDNVLLHIASSPSPKGAISEYQLFNSLLWPTLNSFLFFHSAESFLMGLASCPSTDFFLPQPPLIYIYSMSVLLRVLSPNT